MIDVSELIDDPDFTDGQVVVKRTTGVYTDGDFVPTESIINTSGTIQPLNSDDIEQSPSGDKLKGGIKVWTLTKLYGPDQDDRHLADKVIWDGIEWKVWNCRRFGAHGYYRSECERIGAA